MLWTMPAESRDEGLAMNIASKQIVQNIFSNPQIVPVAREPVCFQENQARVGNPPVGPPDEIFALIGNLEGVLSCLAQKALSIEQNFSMNRAFYDWRQCSFLGQT